MSVSAFDKIKAHLYLAVDRLLTGDKDQKAVARNVLTSFLRRESTVEFKLEKPVEASQALEINQTEGWVCFHCGERMLTHISAKRHFGNADLAIPACLITENSKSILKTIEIVTQERDYLIEMLDIIHIIDTVMVIEKSMTTLKETT
jgi:hypothetical protein